MNRAQIEAARKVDDAYASLTIKRRREGEQTVLTPVKRDAVGTAGGSLKVTKAMSPATITRELQRLCQELAG